MLIQIIKKIVDDPSIIVLPILKKVEETIVGTIKRMAKGLNIPPVKNKRMLNWRISYIKKEVEYKSLSKVALTPNCRYILVISPAKITRWHNRTGKFKSK